MGSINPWPLLTTTLLMKWKMKPVHVTSIEVDGPRNSRRNKFWTKPSCPIHLSHLFLSLVSHLESHAFTFLSFNICFMHKAKAHHRFVKTRKWPSARSFTLLSPFFPSTLAHTTMHFSCSFKPLIPISPWAPSTLLLSNKIDSLNMIFFFKGY